MGGPGVAPAGAGVQAAGCRPTRGPVLAPTLIWVWALALALGLLPTLARARAVADGLSPRARAELLRAQEMAECRPGELQTWPDGRDRAAPVQPLQLVYRHDGAPPWLAEFEVRAALVRAAQAWTGCGLGLSVRRGAAAAGPLAPAQVLVHWHEPDSAGTFGLANPARQRLSLGRGAFGLLRERNPAYPAQDVLQMVLSHEIGHLLGLMAHSRRCVDVTSYYTDDRGGSCQTRDGQDHRRLPEYRALLPTACDLQRCRIANGLAP